MSNFISFITGETI